MDLLSLLDLGGEGFVWPFLVVHLLASSGVAFWPYGSDKMSRPHFSLKTLFWLMAVTAIICVALKQLKPAGKSRHRTGNYFATTYYWQNGIAVTLGTDEASDYPVIRIEARRSLKGGRRRAQALLKPAHPLGDRGRSISAP